MLCLNDASNSVPCRGPPLEQAPVTQSSQRSTVCPCEPGIRIRHPTWRAGHHFSNVTALSGPGHVLFLLQSSIRRLAHTIENPEQ